MSEQLFKMIELPSDEPVQFVGCYVLKWDKTEKPSVAFVEADDEYVSKNKIRELMLIIKEEIDSRPKDANIGKKGCYRRLSELL